MCNFIGSQAKFNSFLVTNEYPKRICLYLVREFDDEPSKIGHFQISKSIFGAKCDLIFLKQKFLFKYKIGRTTFVKSIYFFYQCEKTLFIKNVPYFWQPVIKLSYKIQTNPFRMFICDQKTIEFCLTPYEIPQPWSYYFTPSGVISVLHFMTSLMLALPAILTRPRSASLLICFHSHETHTAAQNFDFVYLFSMSKER